MTTVQLKYFLDAAESLNLSVSAKRLFISQPTLGRHISTLEQELNTRLFDRSNTGLRLTPAGVFFISRATALLEQMQETAHQLNAFSAETRQLVRIGVQEDQQILPALTVAMRNLHLSRPDCSVEIIRGSYHDLTDGLEQGSLDMCQIMLYAGAPTGMFDILPLSHEPAHFAVHRQLLQVDRSSMKESELAALLTNCPVVGISPHMYPDRLLPYLPGTNTTRPHYVDHLSSVATQVICGIAGTFTNTNNLLSLYPDIQMIEISDMPPIVQGCVWRKDNRNTLRIAISEELLPSALEIRGIL